jgi:hypothetical protein
LWKRQILTLGRLQPTICTSKHCFYLNNKVNQRFLLKIAARVTELTMVYFKYKYNRSRPYRYYPALMPPLDTSVHPSYPNGHALFGLMKAYCVADVVPQMREPMLRLAQRIWHNAEIGGFHFPSDAVASGKIAEGAMELLRGVLSYQGCPSYKKAVEAAKLEWQGIIRTG